METDPSLQAIKAAWLSQAPEILSVQLTTVRGASDKFDRQVRRRNLREYIACVVVVIGFGFIAWNAKGWMVQLGAMLVIASAFYIAWHLHRHGSAGRAQPDSSAQSLIHYHRGALVRQRDLLRSVWRWYIGPMVPGMVVMMLGRWFQDHGKGRSIAEDHHVIIMTSIFTAAVFIGVGLLNIWAATKLQKRIAEIDRLLEE